MFALHFQLKIIDGSSENRQLEVIVTRKSLKFSRLTVHSFLSKGKFLLSYPNALIEQHQSFIGLVEQHNNFPNTVYNSNNSSENNENNFPENNENTSFQEVQQQLSRQHANLRDSVKQFFDECDGLVQKIAQLSQKIDVIFIHCDDYQLRRLFYHYVKSFNEECSREKGIVYLIQRQRSPINNRQDNHRNLIVKEDENHNINIQLVFGNCQDLDAPSEDTRLWEDCRKKHKEINILKTLQQVKFSDFREAIAGKKIDILYIKTHEHIEDKESKICLQDGKVTVSISDFCDALTRATEIKFIMLMSCNSHEIAEKIIQTTKVNHVLAAKEIVHNDVISKFLAEFLKLFNYTSKNEIIIASIVRQALDNINDPNNPLTVTVPVLTLFQAEDELPLTFIHRPKKTFPTRLVSFCSLISVLGVLGFGWVNKDQINLNQWFSQQRDSVIPTEDLEEKIQDSMVKIQSTSGREILGVIIAKEMDTTDQTGKNKIYYVLVPKGMFSTSNPNSKENFYLIKEGQKVPITYFTTSISLNFDVFAFTSEQDFLIPELVKESEHYKTQETVYSGRFLDINNNIFELFDSIKILKKFSENKAYKFSFVVSDNSTTSLNIGTPLFNRNGCLIGLSNEVSALSKKEPNATSIKTFLSDLSKYEDDESKKDESKKQDWKLLEKINYCNPD